MPPKNNKKQAEKQKRREEEKRKERIIEDKTFGLKNKNKSAQVQKYIKGVQKQVQGDKNARNDAQFVSKEEKKKSQADQALLSSLLRGLSSMPQPKVEESKTVVCSLQARHVPERRRLQVLARPVPGDHAGKARLVH